MALRTQSYWSILLSEWANSYDDTVHASPVCLFAKKFHARRVRDSENSYGAEMHLTRTALYSIRITLNQSNSSPVYRKSGVDRGTARSALLLATLGVSLSMFSLKQMLASSSHQSRLRRFQ